MKSIYIAQILPYQIRQRLLGLAVKAEFAAAELRRLHAENALLHYTLTTYTELWEAQAVEQTENERLLETQRDALLEALMACDEAMSYMSEYDIPLTLPAMVKAAIAKATGEYAK